MGRVAVAAAILILRSSNRIRHITFFALVIAAMIYAGQPEVAVVMGLALVVFLAILLVLRVPRLVVRVRSDGPSWT